MMRVLGLPLLAMIWIYRTFISPALRPACRYYPSCSQYAEEAVRVHGPILGPVLALRRLLRCHPWAEGGPDPVPPRASAKGVDGSNRGVGEAARREVAAEFRQISETGHQA